MLFVKKNDNKFICILAILIIRILILVISKDVYFFLQWNSYHKMVYILEIIKELFKEIENSFTVRCQIVKPFFPCWRYNQLPQVITLNFEIIHFYQKLFTETSKLINFTRIFKIHPKFLHEFFYTNCFTRTVLHKLIYTNCLISPKFTFICQHLP